MAKGNIIEADLGPKTRTADSRMRGTWSDSGAVTCQSCRYPNQVSQSFYSLSVQNLYCRKCGRMIDREGKLVIPS